MNEKSEKPIAFLIEEKYLFSIFSPSDADKYSQNVRLTKDAHFLYIRKMMKSLRIFHEFSY